MNRVIAFACALAVLPLTASAQHETIQVDGAQSLSGLWKLTFPAGVSGYLPGRGRVISAGMESFCRLQQAGKKVSAHCLPGWGADSETGELDGQELHLAWGIALARAVFDAKIERASAQAFAGVFGLKVFGIRHNAPTPAYARKVVREPGAPVMDGKTGLLARILEELAIGAIVTPHDANMVRNFGIPFGGGQHNTPEEMRSLGKVETVLYLGEGSAILPIFRDAAAPRSAAPFSNFAFSAYQVEFANGERLCGLHQRDDGVLDGFLCV